jgi:hypothetical protein
MVDCLDEEVQVVEIAHRPLGRDHETCYRLLNGIGYCSHLIQQRTQESRKRRYQKTDSWVYSAPRPQVSATARRRLQSSVGQPGAIQSWDQLPAVQGRNNSRKLRKEVQLTTRGHDPLSCGLLHLDLLLEPIKGAVARHA